MAHDQFEDDFDVVEPERPGFILPRWLIGVAALGAVLLLWPGWAGFYSDWLWFKELGYENVFSVTLKTKFWLGAIAVIAAGFLIWLNFKVALWLSRTRSQLVRYITVNKERIAIPDIAGFVERWGIRLSLLLGIVFGAEVWESWQMILQYRFHAPFGEADPLFGRDIAFYVFTLPMLELISQLALWLLIICLIGALALYGLRGEIAVIGDGLTIQRAPRRHLMALVAALFAVLAYRAYLEMPNLLLSNNGAVGGATYTDINARLPMFWVEAGAAALVALLAIVSTFRTGIKLLLAGVALYVLALVASWAYPAFVQRFSVAPNELVKETPYIANNIAATRKAFALDNVEERELAGNEGLTQQDIQDNKATIHNIRLWDHQQLLDTFAQIQEIRTYYEFQSVDNDRYRIGGDLRQTMISPRELSVASLPNRNWINEQLTFTHGFGLTLGPVNQITPQGLPVLFIKDLPPVSTAPELNVTRPEIYFGELSHDPVYVKTSAKEFNYPAGEQNVYSTYEGSGGVQIGSFWRRLMFATRFGDMKLLLSNDVSSESRVLFHRNITERLSRVAPFLSFDSDPYMVISEGRLFWIADAYTTTNRYPYSERFGPINYIRNSVKAVVDAYNGDVKLYLADERDPLIKTWAGIFPGLLHPLSEMPADLRSHLRYPEDIFKIQTAVFSTYHMTEPQVFYNKEDQWEAASTTAVKDQPKPFDPYYTVMKLPGEQNEEFILMLPFTPRSKDNLASWMVARADGEHYGRLRAYRFPKQKLVYGPKQIEARFNQDADISKQLSLWDQRGSKAIRGTLMVVPIKESLIYVQPLYLLAESGKIPELKRVIVAAEDKIAMEETLELSLARIFGNAVSPQPTQSNTGATQTSALPAQPSQSSESLATQAKQHYDRAIQAQREGDWARYGDELKRLGAVLEQMAKPK